MAGVSMVSIASPLRGLHGASLGWTDGGWTFSEVKIKRPVSSWNSFGCNYLPLQNRIHGNVNIKE